MNQTLEIIDKFINKRGYPENKHILGGLFHGSFLTGHNDLNSDIDLLIVTDYPQDYRGVLYIDNQKIEYFEKNIYNIYEQIESHEDSNVASLLLKVERSF